MLGAATGKFTEIEGTLEINPDNLEKAWVAATLPAKTVDTANQL